MLDLFYPPKPVVREPDIFHSMEYGTVTAEQKRRKVVKATNNLKYYLKRKARESACSGGSGIDK